MVLHPGGCGRVGHRRTTIKKVESPNQTPVGALPHLTHHSHRPQAPTSTSGPEPFKSRRRPDVPASVGGYRPGRRQPAAVPAAAPAVPRPRSWRSFLPHVQRPARGRAGVPVAGLSLPMTGGAPVRNFTQQVPGRFAGLWFVEAVFADARCRPAAGRQPGCRVERGDDSRCARPTPAGPGRHEPDCDVVHKTGPDPGWLRSPPCSARNPRQFKGFRADLCLFWPGCFGGGVGVMFSKSPRGRQRRAGNRGRPNPRNQDHDLVTF
jgi:hypothetical protein